MSQLKNGNKFSSVFILMVFIVVGFMIPKSAEWILAFLCLLAIQRILFGE